MSATVLICFAVVMAITVGIAVWAGRKVSDPEMMYAAGGRISPLQNGLAIMGDFVSAAAIFGSVALFFTAGASMAVYSVAPLVGLCLLLSLMAGPLRRLGRFTIGDVLMAKLPRPYVRMFAGCCTLVLSQMYIVAQLVAAGSLFSILLAIPYSLSVSVIGILVVLYVGYGGMLATTWVQIGKAVLLLSGVVLMGVLAVVKAGSLTALHAKAQAAFGPGMGALDSLTTSSFSTLSLAASLVLGMMGMPHLLIRFLTVPDGRAAERSVLISAALVALVLATILLLIGPATLAFVKGVPAYESAPGEIAGGANMIFIHLSNALGGELLAGIIVAVAFSTILAVVAGLGVAMSSTAAHDIFVPWQEGRGKTPSEKANRLIFRLTAAITAFIGVLLALLLQHENVAFLSALAFGIAASTNFPILLLALYWRGLTGPGAVAGGSAGLILSIGLLIAGPTVWQKILGHAEPLFPSDYSTLIAAPAAFLTAMVVSLLGRRPQRSSRSPAISDAVKRL